MSGRPSSAPRGSAARRPRARAVLVAGLLSLSVFGLSACRTLEDDAAETKAPQQRASVAPETPAPEPASVEVPLDPSTPATPAPTPPLSTPPAATPDPAPADDSGADLAAEDPAAAVDEAEDPGEGAVLGTTASSGPPKPLDPWRLVGQPYLVDDEAPEASPDGLTTFTLWFRTKGEFRGVRAGTSVTDDRHYKVGFVSVPELPGYVPGGIGMVQRSDALVRKGRYCYTAEVHLKGVRGTKRFPIRRDGAELQVEFDLKGAPIQRRTATVVVRNVVSEDPPITPAEKALACR